MLCNIGGYRITGWFETPVREVVLDRVQGGDKPVAQVDAGFFRRGHEGVAIVDQQRILEK